MIPVQSRALGRGTHQQARDYGLMANICIQQSIVDRSARGARWTVCHASADLLLPPLVLPTPNLSAGGFGVPVR